MSGMMTLAMPADFLIPADDEGPAELAPFGVPICFTVMLLASERIGVTLELSSSAITGYLETILEAIALRWLVGAVVSIKAVEQSQPAPGAVEARARKHGGAPQIKNRRDFVHFCPITRSTMSPDHHDEKLAALRVQRDEASAALAKLR